MPGTTTSASSATPATNSHGAARCQARIGTWNAIAARTTAAQANAAWRTRYQVACPFVKRALSAVAIEAEYTITRPNASRTSAVHTTLSSYSAALEWRSMRMRRLQPAHRRNEGLAASLVVGEHVEARARGREQHDVPGLRERAGAGHRVGERRGELDGH